MIIIISARGQEGNSSGDGLLLLGVVVPAHQLQLQVGYNIPHLDFLLETRPQFFIKVVYLLPNLWSLDKLPDAGS